MNFFSELPHQRTGIIFYLICFVAIQWASFLLVTEQIAWLRYTLVTIAALTGIFTFVTASQLRTWVFLFLICFVAVLWAAFILNQGVLLWVSVSLVIVSGGIGLFACFLSSDHLEDKQIIKEEVSV